MTLTPVTICMVGVMPLNLEIRRAVGSVTVT